MDAAAAGWAEYQLRDVDRTKFDVEGMPIHSQPTRPCRPKPALMLIPDSMLVDRHSERDTNGGEWPALPTPAASTAATEDGGCCARAYVRRRQLKKFVIRVDEVAVRVQD